MPTDNEDKAEKRPFAKPAVQEPAPAEKLAPRPAVPTNKDPHRGQGGTFIINEQGVRVRTTE